MEVTPGLPSVLFLVHSSEQHLPGMLLVPKSSRLDRCVIFFGTRNKDHIDQLATLLSNPLLLSFLGSRLQLITQRDPESLPNQTFYRSGSCRDLLCHTQGFHPGEGSGHDPGVAGSP